MEFVNTTAASALRYESADQFGGHFHIVILRQRFLITPGGLLSAAVQPAVRDTDEDVSDGPRGLVYQESDLCPYKPLCDVIVNAVAFAPGGNAAPRVHVRLRVESASSAVDGELAPAAPLIDKPLVVTGERRIVRRSRMSRMATSLLRIATMGLVRIPEWTVTSPVPFVACPVRYDYAYGGENRVDADGKERSEQVRRIGAEYCLTTEQAQCHPDADVGGKTVPVAHSAFEDNPFGCGYATAWFLRQSGGASVTVPRIEYPDQPFNAREFPAAPGGKNPMRPAGFSPVGRAWTPRRHLVGAVEEKDQWAEKEFPSLSADFDHRYWNHAAPDQQCRHLRGDEFISLSNLSPESAPMVAMVAGEGLVQRFQLPGLMFYLILRDSAGRPGVKACALDTVYIDPQNSTVDLVWRSAVSAEADAETMRVCAAASGPDRDMLAQLLQHQARLSTVQRTGA